MKLSRRGLISVVPALAAAAIGFAAPVRAADTKEIVYLTPGLDLPFWRYLSKGIESEAKKAGYTYTALDSHNSAETQLKNAQDAIARGVAGIAISPTDSSTAPSVLALAARAKIPVVVRTSAPIAAIMSRSSSPIIIRARSASARRWPPR
jgi:ribose transport system substrate-binding protein